MTDADATAADASASDASDANTAAARPAAVRPKAGPRIGPAAASEEAAPCATDRS
ncbi:hypothetical protein GXW83_19005 [Streptacidiphilus sp. PB12-B1b]|uniref:hypothetical protein n=1 Tax=Streptacidiphilus sp. PB12-B1b TaxID=2705012 RepID=UPI0015FBFF61|nr:hypothetical protein [Streptacidiphilus sp. PB12-B1b]QMU77475.1 hypothetical protein GXW83_19005 [Streptacidiphilus sp. PB12-B1b]